MKRRKRISSWILLLAMLIGLVPSLCDTEMYQAATSYTNAKEFYESTTRVDNPYHAEAANGKVYYATQAKLASSSTNTRYYTVGFDVTLSGNGHSVSFTVQRQGGSMTQVGNPVRSGNYEYNLYVITEDKLFELATKADSTNAAYVLSASTINVRMDAIMTTISAGSTTPNGGITENGYGGFTKRGTIYRLKNSADLKAIKEIFSGHTFESYKEIYVDLDNYLLKVRYNVLGLNPTGNNPTLSNSTYTFDSSGILQKSGSAYFDESRTLKKITLLNTGTIGLSKVGYHLPSGNEWVTDNSRYFASNGTYQSTTVDPTVGYQNHGITLYANWKPNAIKINYNANGGNGTMLSTNTFYDRQTYLSKCTFTRTGYKLKSGAEWNTRADGTGKSYSNQQLATNIISGGETTLYAQWEPCVYKITTDKQGGSGGTDTFYVKYADGFYSDAGATNEITGIGRPSYTGRNFIGYFRNMLGTGDPIVNALGKIAAMNTFFTKDTTIFASWKAQQHSIIFDKNGGTGGDDSVIATYGKLVPSAEGPYKNGYTFMGYYLDENYVEEEKYYTDYMVPLQMFLSEEDITVHAKWLDDIKPDVLLRVKPEGWTNRPAGVLVSASAQDFGSGLSKVILYCGDIPVVTKDNLNGTTEEVVIEYTHTQEGVYQYQVIAYDVDGNVADAYGTCKYDITKPNGTYDVENDDPYNFSIRLDAWDYLLEP